MIVVVVVEGRDSELFAKRVNDKLEPADVTAIGDARARLRFDVAMANLEVTRGTQPGHYGTASLRDNIIMATSKSTHG